MGFKYLFSVKHVPSDIFIVGIEKKMRNVSEIILFIFMLPLTFGPMKVSYFLWSGTKPSWWSFLRMAHPRDSANEWTAFWMIWIFVSSPTDGQCSEAKIISAGIPQGSVLFPRLFVLDINDMLLIKLRAYIYIQTVRVSDSPGTKTALVTPWRKDDPSARLSPTYTYTKRDRNSL